MCWTVGLVETLTKRWGKVTIKVSAARESIRG
jgi:hypothetical protein